MSETFKWRKSFGVNDLDPLTFPKEFYVMGSNFLYLPAKDGTQTMYIRSKMHRKIDSIEEDVKRFIVNQMEKIDAKGGKELGWSIIFDTRDAGYSSLDLQMILFMAKCATDYYPNGSKHFIFVGLPWIINWFAKLALSFVTEETKKKVIFIDCDHIFDYVDRENLPEFMGGTAIEPYSRVPEGTQSLIDNAERYNLTKVEASKLVKQFKEYLSAGEKRIASYNL